MKRRDFLAKGTAGLVALSPRLGRLGVFTAAPWLLVPMDDVQSDRRMRSALLSLLYTARRNDAERPGLGEVDLERLLGCPESHLRFHVWYLRENGLIHRTESGTLAITAEGVDVVLETGGPLQAGLQLLREGAGGREGERA